MKFLTKQQKISINLTMHGVRSFWVAALLFICGVIVAQPAQVFASATTTIILTETGAGSWVVPKDWNSASNTIRVIGAGGSGAVTDVGSTRGGPGGGGGAYSATSSVRLTPGSTVSFSVGAGGARVISTHIGNDGDDTWFCSSSSNCTTSAGSAVIVAAGGGNGGNDVTGGSAGTVITGSGNSGGAGGNGSGVNFTRGAGGGGAGGQSGAGVAGAAADGTGNGGAGNNGLVGGGAGATGGSAVADNGLAGSNLTTTSIVVGSGGGGGGSDDGSGRGGDGGGYGGGGGGGSNVAGQGGAGGQGVIVIEYVPVSNFDQEGFRFREDDGSEAAASWLMAQDTNVTYGLNDTLRFRALAELSGAGITAFPSLQYKKSTDSVWHGVNIDDSYPIIMATSTGRTTSNTSSHSITMPSGIQVGDLLLIIFTAGNGRQRISLESNGWHKSTGYAGGSNQYSLAMFWKFADGVNDSADVTTLNSVNSSHVVYRIRNAGAPQLAVNSNNTVIRTDPPALNTDAERNYLWVTSHIGEDTSVATSPPSGYFGHISIAAFDTAGASVDTAHKYATAQFEDPMPWVHTLEDSSALTIAIPPLMTPQSGNFRSDYSHEPTGSNDSSIGSISWNNPTRIVSLDNSHSALTLSGTTASYYLKGLDFGFNIPANATILGIEPAMSTIRSGGSSGHCVDNVLKLVKNGSVVGNNLATSTTWSNGFVHTRYGSSTELWGTTWTAADINSSNFGMVLSVKGDTASADRTCTVDHFDMNVFYSVPSPIGLAPSTHIATGGASTTAQLTAPAGKSGTDFDAGRIQDDENPTDGVAISTDDYSEVEWSIVATGTAATNDVYQLRLGAGPHASATNYDVNASWTIGTYSPSGQLIQEGYRFRDDDGSETTATWLASQDNGIDWALNDPFRFRGLVDTYNTGTTSAFALQYKLSSSSTWAKVGGNQPVIVATTSGIQGSNSTTHSFTSPAGDNGDLLLLIFSVDANETPSVTTGTGWTLLASTSQSTNVTGAIFYKFADGSDNGVITTTSEQSTHIIYRIRYAGVPRAASATGNSTNSNPPNLNTGVTDDYLWIATRSGDAATTSSAAPSGYSSHLTRAGGTGGASTNAAHRYNVASSEDPGTFTSVTGSWVSFTVAVPTVLADLELASSSNIAASGASTTAQLTAPSGKTSGSDFDAGRIQDDENPADTITVSSDDYTELEWSLIATSTAAIGLTYDLRIGVGTSTALDSYAVNAQVTIGSYVPPGTFTISGTLYNTDRVTPITTGKTIKLVVGTSTPSFATTTTDGSGNWSINISTSSATTTWATTTAAGNDDTWNGVTYGNGKFVAVADGASGDHVMYSVNGVTWATTTAAGDNDNWYDVVFGNGLFVAVSGGGDRVMTSPDGISWTVRSVAGNNDGWTALAYGNGRFVAVSNSGDRVMYSDDGINWATTTAASDDDFWQGVTYGNGLFVAVGSSTSDVVMTSYDGVTWTARSAAGNNDNWRSVAYGNRKFVAVSSVGDRVMHSPDGVTWSTTTAAGDNDTWRNVAYLNGLFVAVASGGDSYVMTSSDGVTWTTQTAVDNDWWDVAHGNGRFVAVGRASTERAMHRHSGIGLDTPITVFVDGDAIDATTLTTGIVGATTSITDVDLYRGHVRVMPGSGDPTLYRGNPRIVGGFASTTALDGALQVAVVGDYAYLTAATDDSFRILNISSSTNPTYVGGVKHATTLNGAEGFKIVGNYAYVAAQNNSAVAVINITNPSSPTIAGSVSSTTALSGVEYLDVSGNYVYAAAGGNDSITVVDVSNPASPTIVGILKDATNLDNVSDIEVRGQYAYVTNQNDDSFRVLDLSSSTAPTLLSGGLKSGTTFDDAREVKIVGNYAYITASSALRIVDVSSSTAPAYVGGIQSIANLYNVTGVEVVGTYAYLTAPNTNDAFRVIDISSSTNPVIVGGIEDAVNLDSVEGLAVRGNHAYVASGASDALRVIDISQTISGPVDLAHYKYPDSTFDSDILFTATTSTTTINANLYIPENTTVIAPQHLEVSGDLILRGTFNNERGEVLLTGDDQAIDLLHTNTSSFYNLTQHAGAASVTTFPVIATLDVDGTLTLEGEVASVLSLRSVTDGVQWRIDAAAASFANLDVKDSYNINLASLSCFDRCDDSGNNTNWIFTFGLTFTGRVFEDAGITPYTSGATVKLVVGTSTPSVFTGLSDAGGNWSITNIATTSGGTTWATTTAAEDDDSWEKVAYGNGIFVAVGSSGDDRVMTSYDGMSWTARSVLGNDDSWRNVVYGNGIFVAVGSSGDRVMTSPDGINWTARTAAGNDDGWYGLAYGNGRFVANSQSGDRIMYSDNGIDWTAVSALGDDDFWTGITYGNNRFVAIASSTSGSQVVGVSFDGINWTAQSGSGDNDAWRSIGFGNGLFVAVGIAGDRLMTSPDGVNWTVQSVTGNNDSWRHVAYANGTFVAVNSGGGELVATSPDGIVWTAQSAPDNDWWGVTYGKGRFVAVGAAGTGRAMYSDGGFGESTPITLYVDGDDVETTTLTTGVTGTSTIRDIDIYSNYLRIAPNTGDTSVYRANLAKLDEVDDDTNLDEARYAAVQGNYAYVTANTANTLVTVDISDPTNIAIVDVLTDITDLSGAEPIVVRGNYAYIGARDGDKLTVVDISSSTNATIVGSVASTGNHLDEPWHIALRGDYVYTTNRTSDSISVIDVSVPTNPRIVGGYASSTILNGAAGIDIEGDLLYVSASVNDGLVIFDISSSTNPIFVQSVTSATTFDNVLKLEVVNNYVYLISFTDDQLVIVDVSSSTNPVVVDTYASSTLLNSPEGLAVDGKYAYVGANAADTLVVFDISSSTNIVLVNSLTDSTNLDGPRFVTARNGIVYLTSQADNSFHTIDVSEPEGPTIVDLAHILYPDSTIDNDILITATTSTTTISADLYLAENTTLIAPKNLILTGDLIQRGAFEAERGNVILTGLNNLIDLSHLNTSSFFDFTQSATANATTTFTTKAALPVEGTLTLEGDSDSVLVLRSSTEGTQWRVSPSTSVDVSYVDVKDSYNVTTTSINCNVGCTDSGNNTNWDFTNALLSLGEHTAGQPSNVFSFQNQSDVPIFAFSLAPNGPVTITSLTLRVTGITSVVATTSIPDLRLYRDIDNDGILDGSDVQVGGAGFFTINSQNGTIVFSTSFVSSTTQNFIVTSDTSDIDKKESLVLRLYPADVAVNAAVSGSVSAVQHHRHIAGAGGSGASIGGDAPAGQGVRTGGGDGGGNESGGGAENANILFDPNFFRPTSNGSPNNEWTNGGNGYISDGSNATAGNSNLRQTYGDFGFSVPPGNSIVGIAVKLDASGSTAAGTIQVSLSWNGGTNFTSTLATPTLATNDVVYLTGGESDTWGRSWTPSEFSNANFRVRVTSQVSGNTVRLDALEVRVYHQAGGGGGGGGGAI